MNLLSLDLELNQPSGLIIQVGACVINKYNGEIKDKFMVYVNPQEKINPEITELTGITQENVEIEGIPVKEAYFKLKEFALKHRVFINPLVWGSGVWNDSSHLHKEANPGEANFMGFRVWDVKTLYQVFRAINGKKIKGGLNTAVSELGLTFKGRNHDALDDAINTAIVFAHLSSLLIISDPKIQNQ